MCSPGGTTAAAIRAFEAGGLRATVADAMEAAATKSHAISQASKDDDDDDIA